jgi:hypothetical protein
VQLARIDAAIAVAVGHAAEPAAAAAAGGGGRRRRQGGQQSGQQQHEKNLAAHLITVIKAKTTVLY